MNRREFVAGGLALSVAAKAGPAWAQSGPPTKIVFPFAAGGSGDMLCRQLAEYLPATLDRRFIVENRTGGDGLIGIRSVKAAAPAKAQSTAKTPAAAQPAKSTKKTQKTKAKAAEEEAVARAEDIEEIHTLLRTAWDKFQDDDGYDVFTPIKDITGEDYD